MKTNLDETSGDFWAGETCECCGGEIAEKRITLHRQANGRHALFENVPAGVCKECGTRYYSANVLKRIQESLKGRKKAQRKVAVPVFRSDFQDVRAGGVFSECCNRCQR